MSWILEFYCHYRFFTIFPWANNQENRSLNIPWEFASPKLNTCLRSFLKILTFPLKPCQDLSQAVYRSLDDQPNIF